MTRRAESSAVWQASHPGFHRIRQPESETPSLKVVSGRGKGPIRPPNPLSLTWDGAEYPHVKPGIYQAVCVALQGPEYVRRYQRYSLRLEFSLLDDGTAVSLFLNFSDGKVPGSQSNYFKYWSMANGETPIRGQHMSPQIFTEPGLLYSIRVEDARTDSKGEAKPEVLVYSRVSEILKAVRK
jgi:hypothetical protein